MVSFWPWKGDDGSPASFERTLSALATSISKTQATLDRTISTSRRARVLSTLYLAFAYLVYAIVLALVVGWKNITPVEWAVLAGGPIAIYAIRTALSAYFNFRVESLSAKLRSQQHERGETIQKLKDATKYESTLQLLEKYGGSDAKPEKSGKGKKGGGPGNPENNAGPGSKKGAVSVSGAGRPSTGNRTNMPPPPTANIRLPEGQPPLSGPILPPAAGRREAASAQVGLDATSSDLSAEFAPNAFGPGDVQPSPARLVGGQYAPSVSASSAYGESHWYDRILDLLMGEDETASRNRLVLICSACRLVNGQAPPGTASLADLGTWRCMGCGAMNGEESEAKKIVDEVLEEEAREIKSSKSRSSRRARKPSDESDSESEGGEDTEEESEQEVVPVPVPKKKAHEGARRRGTKNRG